MIAPLPPHMEQGCEIENRPWPWDSTPRPWQRGHTFGDVPGFAPVPWQVPHMEDVGTDSETCAPSTACWKLRRTSASRSRPRSGCGVARPPAVPPPRPEPNRFDRMSEKLPASKPPPAAPPPAPNGLPPANGLEP